MTSEVYSPLKGSQKDLKLAKALLEELANCTDLEEFQELWQDFLARLERAWHGAEAKIGPHPKGQAWVSKHAGMRRKDQLLNYMKQARNSEWHVVSSTVASNTLISLTNRSGGHVPIQKIESNLKDGVLTINLTSNNKDLKLDAKVIPGQPRLTRTQNRGTWYDPPRKHMDMTLQDVHPVAVGALCIKYYEECFREEEEILLIGSQSD